jgi:signal peptidase I
MGLPGEAIEIRDNQVLIDNKPLPLQPLPNSDFLGVTEQHHMGSNLYDEAGHWVAFTPGGGESRNFGPIKLNSDEYFLLGDNRDVSLDCRSWGPLKEKAIRGKVVLTRPTGPRRK